MTIETKKLTKFYGKTLGIKNLNLSIPKGEFFGFLGPNGAGKTTTIRLLLDFIRPTKGSAKVFGLDSRHDSFEIKKKIGYIPGDIFFYDWMKGRDYLRYFSRFHARKDSLGQELVRELDLDLGKRIKTYSKGNRQKLAIVAAFSHDPDLLILDEPTLGLDPLVQHQFYKILLREKEKGKTVFLSSHILSEVERVCDRVGIVKQGKLITIERISDLKKKKIKNIRVKFKEKVDLSSLKIKGVKTIEKLNDYFNLTVRGNVDEIVKMIAAHEIDDLTITEASLEEIFLEYYES